MHLPGSKLGQQGSFPILLIVLLGLVAFLVVSNTFDFKNNLFSKLFNKKSSYAVSSIRSVPGDLWADVEIGKRDFGEISPREIVPYKLSAPGGVIVDRSVSPGRMYVWDSGNSRILGVDLARCYGSSTACSTDLVLGQPSASDYGACNGDASFGNYPNRNPASASTLCGIPESTHTTLEHKSFSSMFVDSGGHLYVPDSFNHRVLKYNSPFSTDTVADDVWGQSDFSGNGCNITGGIAGGWNNPSPPPPPTASSLCFHSIGASGAGVTRDAQGNLWVADGGNNRVLRFPKNLDNSDVIAKTADLVLGQPNFTTGGDWSYGSTMDKMRAPAAVRFDNLGNLYVADSGNNRVLVFAPPFTNGMSASGTLGSNLNDPLGVEIDPAGAGVWVFNAYYSGGNGKLQLWSFGGALLKDLPAISQPGGGSVGIDINGNLLASAYVYGNDVYRYALQPDGSYIIDKQLFSPPGGYNLTTARRFEHPGFVGLTVVGNQLIVANKRVLFWNNVASLANGQTPDGYVGVNSFTELPNPDFEFEQVKSDTDNRVWIARPNEIRIYQAPLSTGASPIKTLTSPLSALGGGTVSFNDAYGIAVTSHSEFLWVSDVSTNRVFRVKNPLTTPLVDIVLGQTSLSGNQCNRGVVPAPNTGTTQDADLTMLCYPGALSIDRKGNLYVSDHFLETQGNWRLLMFDSGLFPASPSTIIFAPAATKSFPRSSSTNQYSHMTFEPAFDSTNRMVVGYNPYSGKRFAEYYNDPTRLNPANPADPTYAQPDGQLNDFYGWPVAATFDSQNNLYLYDANRGQVRIYQTPFVISTPSAPPTPTPSTAPTPTPRITVNAVVTSSSDDAEESVTSGGVNLNSSDLELTCDTSTVPCLSGSSAQQTIGMRFSGLSIPKGATITNAYVEFTTKETTWKEATNLSLWAEDVDNSVTFTSTKNSISSRPKTISSVTWNNLPVWSISSAKQPTPDLSTLVQQVVNRPGWTLGNALSIIINGLGHRTPYSFDGSSANAPKLVVTYTTTGPLPTLAPTPAPTPSSSPNPSSTPTGTTTISSQVIASSDDVEQNIANGSMYNSSSDLELTADGTTIQTIGMRFGNISIPQGATITNAYVEFVAKETQPDTTNINFYGQAIDNAPAFTTAAFNVSSRTKTSSAVGWNAIPVWSVGSKYQTPNLASVVQEVINRPGWISGNVMALIVTGSGHRTAYSFDGSSTKAAKLVVTYK